MVSAHCMDNALRLNYGTNTSLGNQRINDVRRFHIPFKIISLGEPVDNGVEWLVASDKTTHPFKIAREPAHNNIRQNHFILDPAGI